MCAFSRQFVFVFLLCCGASSAAAQVIDTIAVDEDLAQDILENVVQNLELEGDFNFNDLGDQLLFYLDHPLDINKASGADLASLQLLSDGQIASLLQYRAELGDLLEVYELQAVPGFDLGTIKGILPFVTLKSASDYLPSIAELWEGSQTDVLMRWGRNLESLAGFSESASENSRFLGDPNNFYVRFRKSYGRRFSVGVTAEKDAGEEFFEGSNAKGFDFYSAHLALQDITPWLKSVHLGDYSIQLGQGLIQFNGFGYGKSAAVNDIRRQSWAVRPYTSRGEGGFFRGAAIELNLAKNLEFLAFGSRRLQDANQVASTVLDTLDEELRTTVVSSLQISGLHRTPNEVADENTITWESAGGRLKWSNDRRFIALNMITDRLSQPLLRSDQPYNQFRFGGSQNTNVSLDYSYLWRNINFFGETGWASYSGALATTNGAIITLDRKTELSVLFRHFPIDFEALHGFPFAERAIANNETGLYAGIQHRFSRKWIWSVYADGWQHPWLRFRADGPTKGWEGWTRLEYRVRRKGNLYVQFRQIERQENGVEENKFDGLVITRRQQARLQGSWTPMKGLTLRQRWEYNRFSQSGTLLSEGWMIYQDVLVKPMGSPWSGNVRLAIFDTDDSQTRIYTFENSLTYDPIIPAFSDQGVRYYFNVRFKGIRNVTLEGRFAQTYILDRADIGSGPTASSGPRRSDVRFQARVRF